MANPFSVVPRLDEDLARVEQRLLEATATDNPAMTAMARHLLLAGGKRIRPSCCLAAASLGAPVGEGSGASAATIDAAAAIELVHLGSLYHDDVIDHAATRRGVPSVNARWDEATAIVSGDFVLAQASVLSTTAGAGITALLASTIGRLCDGQLLELESQFDTGRTAERYRASALGKTAALLETSCRVGALCGGAEPDVIDVVAAFGRSYGIAFQLLDDVIDLTATVEEAGKPTSHDMAQGVYTLAVIAALGSADGDRLRSLLRPGAGAAERDEALAIVRRGPWIDDVIGEAAAHAGAAADALDHLPPRPGLVGFRAAADQLVRSVDGIRRS
ncbi:MAG: polyprenyl synthetase family protein [Microthrixaceae bacterium]